MNLDFTPSFQRALTLMETSDLNLFITGRAGTGKSTLLNYFRTKTAKNVAVLAPTGVAALNVQGQTIHSFFKFKPTVTVESIRRLGKSKERDIYRSLDAIVIDEISMVRADLLDCIDRFLRLNGKIPEAPFGGVQMIFIGDLYQLPPIVSSEEKEAFYTYYKSPYFFSARFFSNFDLEFIELDKIYRQKDPAFIHLLNAIRDQAFTPADIAHLNSRVKEDFDPPDDGYFVYLTPYTANAQALNDQKLGRLPGTLYEFQANIEGDFKKDAFPTLPSLAIRPQAQVMMVNNDPRGRWINGTMGKVLSIEDKTIHVRLETGENVNVLPNKWEISRFFLEEDHLKAKVVGSFTQYPLTLAWALTIHKSQGKTFDKVIFDVGRGTFAAGQVYVALSRCTTLDGLVLKKPIHRHHMWPNPEITNFLARFMLGQPDMSPSLEAKKTHVEQAIQSQSLLRMLYHRADGQSITLTVTPLRLDSMVYQGETYWGFEGILPDAQKRIFKVERIMQFLDSPS